jgi:hypothetical protein
LTYGDGFNAAVTTRLSIQQKATVEPTTQATPTSTPTQTQDNTQYFKNQMAGYGWTVNDLTKVSSNTYNGTRYEPTGRSQTLVMPVTIETFSSESAAKTRYDQWTSEKIKEGYNPVYNPTGGTLDPRISAKVHWGASKPPLGGCGIRYVYDTSINLWVVTSFVYDIVDNNTPL